MNNIKHQREENFKPLVNNSLKPLNDKPAYANTRCCPHILNHISSGVGLDFAIAYITKGKGL